jgi:hypothetical protein
MMGQRGDSKQVGQSAEQSTKSTHSFESGHVGRSVASGHEVWRAPSGVWGWSAWVWGPWLSQADLGTADSEAEARVAAQRAEARLEAAVAEGRRR